MYAEVFIKKQSEMAEPLEFLNMNTGYVQVKYHILKQWPILSGDISSIEDLLHINLDDVNLVKHQAHGGLDQVM